MINDRNHVFPLSLLRARGTTLPLEAIGGCGGTLDDPGVKDPTARAELEGNVVEVKSKLSCPPQSQLHVSMDVVTLAALKYQSPSQNLSPSEVEHSPPSPPPHVYSISK